MDQELIAMTEKWKGLERKTVRQREKAENFYETKLMKLIEEEFIANNIDKVYEMEGGRSTNLQTERKGIGCGDSKGAFRDGRYVQ